MLFVKADENGTLDGHRSTLQYGPTFLTPGLTHSLGLLGGIGHFLPILNPTILIEHMFLIQSFYTINSFPNLIIIYILLHKL